MYRWENIRSSGTFYVARETYCAFPLVTCYFVFFPVVDGLTVTNIEPRSISLQWLQADNDNVNGYFIIWKNNEKSQNKTIDANSTIITELIPHTHYHLCVVPLLISGNGTEICVQQLTLQAGMLHMLP